MMVDPYEQGKMFSLLGNAYSNHLNDGMITKYWKIEMIFEIFDSFRKNRHFS